jgi:hypothetical protein
MAGRVVIVLLDNGATAITVPQNSTQLVIGCSSIGTVAAPYASTSPGNIQTQFGWGPLPEAAAMIAAVGGVPVCVKATTATAGSQTAVTHTGTGTSVVTVTGNAFDTYEVLVTPVVAGTIGTSASITVSLDAGRTTSPPIALGTATTYVIPNTGLTLNFAAGTLIVGTASAPETYTFGTTEPLWNAAGIQAAINAFLASSYGKQGVGSVHIVGGSTLGGATGSDMVSVGGYLQTARTNQFVPMHAYMSARDAAKPTGYGAGETESAWMTALNADHPSQSLNPDTTGRISVCAAYWNMQSQLTNGLGLSPRFRRSVAYAVAQRDVQISPQRMPSRVKDGALLPIVVSPADKLDGFVYHDESVTPGLDSTRGGSGGNFSTTTTIAGLAGVFLQHANLFSPVGSSYGYMPQGHVIDILSSIAYQVGVQEIDNDVRITSIGGIDPRDAATISSAISSAVQQNMTNQGMLVASASNSTGCKVTIDTTASLAPGGPGILPITVLGFGKGYILAETISVGFAPAGQS